ncbi:hypothetical protein HYU14_01365 [Candidatus Woesearchaeota archaeon]|nr:hypothetical protein [Candidatus Woesearchaeota archaeon]
METSTMMGSTVKIPPRNFALLGHPDGATPALASPILLRFLNVSNFKSILTG